MTLFDTLGDYTKIQVEPFMPFNKRLPEKPTLATHSSQDSNCTYWVSFLEKALAVVNFSYYDLLADISLAKIFKHLVGPVPLEFLSHDQHRAIDLFDKLKVACSRELVLYASNGSEKSMNDPQTGRIFHIANCYEFDVQAVP